MKILGKLLVAMMIIVGFEGYVGIYQTAEAATYVGELKLDGRSHSVYVEDNTAKVLDRNETVRKFSVDVTIAQSGKYKFLFNVDQNDDKIFVSINDGKFNEIEYGRNIETYILIQGYKDAFGESLS